MNVEKANRPCLISPKAKTELTKSQDALKQATQEMADAKSEREKGGRHRCDADQAR